MDLSTNGRLDGLGRSANIHKLVGLAPINQRSAHSSITPESVRALGTSNRANAIAAKLLAKLRAGKSKRVNALVGKLVKACADGSRVSHPLNAQVLSAIDQFLAAKGGQK